ncbi:MAG: hypothetical protein IT364_06870 [Candidatus Hydrogenedentes bacterium]|nr:hypothetical protein [Candidatus Hydrogenedentota bacterium]
MADSTLMYTQHGSPAFEIWLKAQLAALTRDIVEALRDNLVAVVLGGGYGRGEGGVVVVDGQERPYNDLDLILVVRNPSAVPRGPLEAIQAAWPEKLFGIHVDMSRPQTIEQIKTWPHYMMWQDVLLGHIVLSGPQDVIRANAPDILLKPLPLTEALRLMLNRGAGLLFALRIAARVAPPEDEDFVRRNYFKCAQALGDTALMIHEKYKTPYAGREALFADLCDEHAELRDMNIRAVYEESLLFRSLPDRVEQGPPCSERLHEMARSWSRMLLYLETSRTGIPWKSTESYASWTGVREPDVNTLGLIPKNLARNLVVGSLSYKHPRERLYREMARLLGASPLPVGWEGTSERMLRVWQRFN